MNQVLKREPLLMTLAVIHLALFLVCLMLATVDPRLVAGVNTWFKPAKFAISIATYLFTAACLLTPLARDAVTASLRWLTALAMAGEIALITTQAARGVPSHFNNSSPLDGLVFSMMGALILVNTTAAAGILWMYLRHAPPLAPHLLMAVRLGLVIFITASLQGFMMVANGAHTVGAPDGARGIFFLNWSLTHGDLRIPHLTGLHALQGLPIVAWLSGSRKAVLAVAAAWALVFLLTLALALAGMPLLALPAR